VSETSAGAKRSPDKAELKEKLRRVGPSASYGVWLALHQSFPHLFMSWLSIISPSQDIYNGVLDQYNYVASACVMIRQD
jgi:hypothetical protein